MENIDKFVHLHVHSSIGSMQDAMTNIDDMFKRAAELGQKALALTDHGTMAGIFDARKASIKYGIKFIPGVEAYFVDDVSREFEKDDARGKRRHIVLLAQNSIGYKNLLFLNYNGYLNNQYVPVINKVFPRLDWNLLKKYSEGVICLTACGSGIVARAIFDAMVDDINDAGTDVAGHNAVVALKNIFGDNLYLEVQPHDLLGYVIDRKTGDPKLDKSGNPIIRIDQSLLNKKLYALGKETNTKLVATCDVHYLNKEDAKAHDLLMAVNDKKPLSDRNRHKYNVDEFYFKSSGEIIDYFSKNFTRKMALEICTNTIDIADRCENPTYLDCTEIRFPKFDIHIEPDYSAFCEWWKTQTFFTNGKRIPEDHAFMRYRCINGFKTKLGHLNNEEKQKYIQRMRDEIKVLEMHNFSSYMLIVADFIKKAQERDILVGPGRGSVGGSLVGHLLGIHTVDPIKYGLLFERFHNKEKKSFPDIDTDFSSDGRDWVQNYIVNKYGHERVAHVSNLSKITPKVVIKDIARSLEIGGSKSKAFQIANKITDAIANDANTFDDALSTSSDLREYCAKYPEIEQYGRKLVGLEKAYATHAAGIVIGDVDLSTYVPLRIDKDGNVSVQYEKNRCEAVGLIKMDLLGLEHLRIISNTIKNSRGLGIKCPVPEDILLDDGEVWEDISKGKTMCVFQMGSPHMRALCKRIQPRNIEDLSLVNALGRPSAERSRDSYIARRDGKEKVTYKYEFLKPALEETLGICVYEEQLAKLANCAAGWDLNKADGLRKLTKLKGKDPKLAAKLREDFIRDTMECNKVKEDDAAYIWDNIIEPFEGYGFNKAHGVFYSINGYHTAYYKHYYPAAFMSAVLQSEVEKGSSPSRDSNIQAYKKEAARLGISIKSPDVAISGESFTVLNKNALLTGLKSVKGVGSSAVVEILKVRDKHAFTSFADFLYRTSSNIVKKNVIQKMAKAGCFINLGITRKVAFTYYQDIRTKANKYASEAERSGVNDFERLNGFKYDRPELNDEFTLQEILQGESETLGECVSGTINDLYGGFFTNVGITTFNKLKKFPDKYTVKVEAIVSDIKLTKVKTGKTAGKIYAKLFLTDINNDNVKLVIWPQQWESCRNKIEVGTPIRAVCRINIWNGSVDLVLERLEGVKQ